MRGCLPDRVGALTFLKGMVFQVSELSQKQLLGDGRPRVPAPQPKVNLALDRSKQGPDVARQAVSKTELGTVQDLNRIQPVPYLRNNSTLQRCFICASPSHLAKACPQRVGNVAKNRSVPRPYVNTLVPKQKRGTIASQENNDNQVMTNSQVNHATVNKYVVTNDNCFSRNDDDKVTESPGDIEQRDKTSDDTETTSSRPSEDQAIDSLLADGWSELRYVQINIEGLPEKVTSLNDSGCQLCVARRDVLKSLNLPKLGEAKLKGLSKEVIPADLVRVRMKLADGSAFSNVTCAVVDNLNHSVILGSDIVEKLNVKLAEEQCCINDVIDVDVINIDNNVIDGDVMSDVTNADNGDDDNDVSVDPRKASADILRTEQKTDRSLAGCWSLAERQKAGYFVRDEILYRQQKMLGHEYEQLVLPAGRTPEVIKLGHEVVGGHLASKKKQKKK